MMMIVIIAMMATMMMIVIMTSMMIAVAITNALLNAVAFSVLDSCNHNLHNIIKFAGCGAMKFKLEKA